MSLELLRELAHHEAFPVAVNDQVSIDRLRVLKAAGMVDAQLPDEPGQPAWVHALTGWGRATLRADGARTVLELRQARRIAVHGDPAAR